MQVPFVDLKAQYLSIQKEIDSAIKNVIDQTAFIGGGTVKKFEKRFCRIVWCKTRHQLCQWH